MSIDPISLRSKMDAATALPWSVRPYRDKFGLDTPVATIITAGLTQADAEFIVVAVNAIPQVVDSLDVGSLEGRVIALTAEMNDACTERDSMVEKVVQATKERDEAMDWRTLLEPGVEHVKELADIVDGPAYVGKDIRDWLARVAAKAKG